MDEEIRIRRLRCTDSFHDNGLVRPADQLASIPRDGPVTVFCRSGRRAGIAASLLDAAGVDVRVIPQGGAADWPAASQESPAASASGRASPTDTARD